jgi:hypothetical protein
MKQTKVLIRQLIETIEANGQNHHKKFEEAFSAYRERVIEVLEQNLADAKAGRAIRTYIDMPIPEDHSIDYDIAIGMLQMALDAGETTVDLSFDDYRRYVLDKWGWSEAFRATSQSYGVK